MAVLISLLLTLRDGVRSPTNLQLEVLALRHQLHVLKRAPARGLRLNRFETIGNIRAISRVTITPVLGPSSALTTARIRPLSATDYRQVGGNTKGNDRLGRGTTRRADTPLSRDATPSRGSIEFGPVTARQDGGSIKDDDKRGGGSDDIGDISWNLPTITLRFPSNIPGLPGHNWANAIAMATPIAHKGVVAGAKVQAMTILDIVMKPELVKSAWDYFTNVQTKDQKYIPFIARDTPPPTWLNKGILEKYWPEMRKYYYDPGKYPTYLEQLGIKYPTVRAPQTNSQR